MAGLTLDRVLTEAEALPADEQAILENLLRQRRIETWRQDTAAEAKKGELHTLLPFLARPSSFDQL
jgi:hypothetical protein